MNKSSNGNPYHDQQGKFATADGAKTVVQNDKKYYNDKTSNRGNQVYFGVTSPQGDRILFRQSSMIHTKKGHPIMCKKENRIAMKEVLKDPEYIYKSESHDNRMVFFGKSDKATFKDKMYIKVIVEKKEDHAEVVSAWTQKKVKGNIKEKIYEK